eukprot:CAMPEP_0171208750 /NCGR_PEP_ID=MMETSP0790-20130122/28247_1 /TAXON_ID=2925 /ORGANISM="Alexandrium catenella, Strain OF101" /LENGTH=58 /DNA_ID=CAMNT_0011674351 /DNA_START=66 /DNA_END=238 /DNA_ORIENTATION=+
MGAVMSSPVHSKSPNLRLPTAILFSRMVMSDGTTKLAAIAAGRVAQGTEQRSPARACR